MTVSDAAIADSIHSLLGRRTPDATICPSEVARALAPDDWRSLMPQVRSVACALAVAGTITIRQKGVPVDPQAPLRGPIRLGRRDAPSGPPNQGSDD